MLSHILHFYTNQPTVSVELILIALMLRTKLWFLFSGLFLVSTYGMNCDG